MIVYPYVRLPSPIAVNVPDNFHIALTESGWMTSKLFFEFIANPFINWLNDRNIPRPVILFVDGHKTHVTMQTSVLCEDIGIILYLLPPNTTHIMQPADVGPFRPFKHYWREKVIEFQRLNPGTLVCRKDVAPLLNEAMKLVAENCIINGFKKSGIHPFNVDAVDFARCLDASHNDSDEDDNVYVGPFIEETVNYKEGFRCIKKVLGEEKTLQCLNGNLDASTLTEMVKAIAAYSGEFEDSVLDNSKIMTQPPADPTPSSTASVTPVLAHSDFDDTPTAYSTCDDDNCTITLVEPSNYISMSEEMTKVLLGPSHSSVNEACEASADAESLHRGYRNDGSCTGFTKRSPSTSSSSSNVRTTLVEQKKVKQSTLINSIYKFYPGKVEYKKHKKPSSPQRSIVSGQKFRIDNIKKNISKKTKNGDVWVCAYCDVLYDDDMKNNLNVQWIECDDCQVTQHISCLPKSHLTIQNFDMNADENDFRCEMCFTK